MGQNLNKLNKKTHSQLDELKRMFLAMNNLLADEHVRQTVSRNKLIELETWVSSLAQSSISPDTLREIKILLDVLADNSKPLSSNDNKNDEINLLRAKLSQVYMKLQGTDELCVNICKSVDNITDDDDINRELQKQVHVIKQIQNENKMYMSEIVQQLNNMSQIIDNETKK